MQPSDALLACHRFGMGARPGDCTAIASDPRGWLHDQLTTTPPLPEALQDLPTSAEVARQLAGVRGKGSSARKALRRTHRALHRTEALARTLAGVRTAHPLQERLVRFLSDVFTISVARVQCLGLAGSFEREVLRPGATGRFADLLLAATKHPAMLVYLDNVRSTGPDSPAGTRRERGLNENLARELLELHTLGVGHYTQDDVLALANVLTGWSVGKDGRFHFATRRHQPGDQVLLGTRYAAGGMAQGEAALRDLAAHPATARRLSWRMARHFIADDPPEATVRSMEAAWQETDGDLSAVVAAMLDSPAAWKGGLVKLRRPDELVIATLRALPAVSQATTDQGDRLLGALDALGQVPWSAPSPEGWPDTAADWLGGDALLGRLRWSWEASQLARDTDPLALADQVLPGALSRKSRRALQSAPDRQTGVALLLASPPFQRR